MIAHILLLPHAEHRERLLAPGAPCAWYGIARERWRTGWMVRPEHYVADDDPKDQVVRRFTEGPIGGAMHLVLARDGAVCPEGVMRAWHMADDTLYDDGGLSDALYESDLRNVADVVASWRRNGTPLGTLLLIDADGREVVGG